MSWTHTHKDNRPPEWEEKRLAGLAKIRTPEWEAKRIAAVLASPGHKERARTMSFKYREKAIENRSKNPVCQKGILNINSSFWMFKDPFGQTHNFMNVSDFVRTHGELFPEDNTKHKDLSPRAAIGLARLRPYTFNGKTKKNVSLSYHGWTWAGGIKEEHDLLDRQIK